MARIRTSTNCFGAKDDRAGNATTAGAAALPHVGAACAFCRNRRSWMGSLAANSGFRLLWSARGVSFLGDSLSLVALLLYVAQGTGQALAVAALLLVGGVRCVLLVDAATFAVSAVLLARLPAVPPAVGPGSRTSFRADARVGLRYLWTENVLRIVTLGFLAVVAFNGVDDVALVFLTRDDLGGSQSATALLYGAVGIGLLSGYALLARHAVRDPALEQCVAGDVD